MDKVIKQRINDWLTGNYEESDRAEVRRLLVENPEEIMESFYKHLEFGTGGLRGIMGVGTNRVNKYTIGLATQGLANYLVEYFRNRPISVVIAYDSRNKSSFFAQIATNIFSANDIKVYVFESLCPTPLLSFAIRELACQSGVMITASHNPKEYNGYKVYWEDGGQITSPHDKNIISKVISLDNIDKVRFKRNSALIEKIEKQIEKAYLKRVKKSLLSKEAIRSENDLRIVFTPIHGTGITIIPNMLQTFGFNNVYIVDEQAEPDGDFPTVVYPNPEEPDALQMGIEKAIQTDAEIVLATDPDADRVGIAIRNHKNEFQLLNGNQTAVLLFDYLIRRRKEKKVNSEKDFIAKTIVTTPLIDKIALHHEITCENTLTGFKYIAEIIKDNEKKRNFVAGCEESYGYLTNSFVRDKDAVSTVALICEMAAYLKTKKISLFDRLMELYIQYGLYKEKLVSITRKGKKGIEEIQHMMKNFRENSPNHLNNCSLIKSYDYMQSIIKDFITHTQKLISLPKADVVQFVLEDESVISIRPSGTEPKIKFYFSVHAEIKSKSEFDRVSKKLDKKIENIISDLGIK